MRVQAIDIALNPPSGPFLAGDGLCHVEFQGAPVLGIGQVLRMRFIRCVFWDGCKRFLYYPLFSHPKSLTREKRSAKGDLLPIL